MQAVEVSSDDIPHVSSFGRPAKARSSRVPRLTSLCCDSLAPFLAAPDFPFDALEMMPWEGLGSQLFQAARKAKTFARAPKYAAEAFIAQYGQQVPRSFSAVSIRQKPLSVDGTALHSGTSFSRADTQIANRIIRLSSLTHLVRLELRNAGLKDGDLHHLCSLTRLVTLDLADNQAISDNGVGLLVRASLSGAGTKRPRDEEDKDSAEEASHGFANLEHFNLAGTSIGDPSMTHLARLPNLLALDVSRTFVSYGEGIKPLVATGLHGWSVLDPDRSLFPEPEAKIESPLMSFWMRPLPDRKAEAKARGDAIFRRVIGSALLANSASDDPALSFVIQETSRIDSDPDLVSFVLGDNPDLQAGPTSWRRRRFWDEIDDSERDEFDRPKSTQRVWVAGSRTTVHTVTDDGSSYDPFRRTFKPEFDERPLPAWAEKEGRSSCTWRLVRAQVPIIHEVQVKSRGFGVYKAPEPSQKPQQKQPPAPKQGLMDHTGNFATQANVVPLSQKKQVEQENKKKKTSNPFASSQSSSRDNGFDLDEMLGKKENGKGASRFKEANKAEWWKGWTK